MELLQLQTRVTELEEFVKELAKWAHFNQTLHGNIHIKRRCNVAKDRREMPSRRQKRRKVNRPVGEMECKVELQDYFEMFDQVEETPSDDNLMADGAVGDECSHPEEQLNLDSDNTERPEINAGPIHSPKLLPLVSSRKLRPKSVKITSNGTPGPPPKPKKSVLPSSTPDLSITCPHCSKIFKKRAQLRIHIKTVHSTPADHRPFMCELCSKCFRFKTDLTSHLRTHSTEKPHQCPHCLHRSKTKSHLNSHVKSVHKTKPNGRPWKCYFCPKAYAFYQGLVYHFPSHTGEQPLHCPKCDYAPKSRQDLRAHLLHNHGNNEIPFACQFCLREFRSKSNLTMHEKRHRGEKSFLCQFCPYATITQGMLNQHFKRKHSSTLLN